MYPMAYQDLFPDDELIQDSEYKGNKKFFRLLPAFSGKYAKRWFVIVETYDHKNFGKGERRYLAEFSQSERNTISKWHTKLHRWYLVTGCPRYFVVSVKTAGLLNRAADFFATI